MLEIRDFLAIPFKHEGRTFEGADCFGFIRLFYLHVRAIAIPDVVEHYAPDWAKKGKNYFLENYHRYFDKFAVPEKYDLVFFYDKRGVVDHGGIVLGPGRFIHMCGDGVMQDSYNRPQWKKRIAGFYRYRGEKCESE